MKFYEMVPFSFHLTPESIVEAAKTITTAGTSGEAERANENQRSGQAHESGRDRA